MADKNQKKIVFELEQDADGYPPDRLESVWANEVEPGHYAIDNIPFFIKGISCGDIVLAEEIGGELRFKDIVRPSLNSVLRLYVSDMADVQIVRNSFRDLGCPSEQSHIPALIAVEIPGTVAFAPIAALLAEGEQLGRWEYEEGVLRHVFSH